MTEPESIELRSRTIAHLHCDNTLIIVEHVYEPEGTSTCDDCHSPMSDPGMVALALLPLEEDEGPERSILMEPGLATDAGRTAPACRIPGPGIPGRHTGY